MPDNGGTVCDLACRTKIIINGDTVSGVLNAACEAIKGLKPEQIKHGKELIELLNQMEDEAFQVQRLVLDGVGFAGPFPKSLS
jgi:hypothetical protein